MQKKKKKPNNKMCKIISSIQFDVAMFMIWCGHFRQNRIFDKSIPSEQHSFQMGFENIVQIFALVIPMQPNHQMNCTVILHDSHAQIDLLLPLSLRRCIFWCWFWSFVVLPLFDTFVCFKSTAWHAPIVMIGKSLTIEYFVQSITSLVSAVIFAIFSLFIIPLSVWITQLHRS